MIKDNKHFMKGIRIEKKAKQWDWSGKKICPIIELCQVFQLLSDWLLLNPDHLVLELWPNHYVTLTMDKLN